MRPNKKKPKKRVILLKDTKDISPLKSIPETSSLPLNFERTSIPQIPESNRELSLIDVEAITSNADSLLSVELMKTIVEQEHNHLEKEFFPECDEIVKKAFDASLHHYCNSLAEIKEERIERVRVY